jgi:hypothetical protein
MLRRRIIFQQKLLQCTNCGEFLGSKHLAISKDIA